MKIILSDKAQEMLTKNLTGTDKFLRINIIEGGCAGFTYGAEIDQTLKDSEEIVFHSGAIKIASDPKSRQYLEGLHIDYSDDLLDGGLKFTNPQAVSTCGCGSSFNLAGFPVKEGGSCSGI